MELNLEKLRKFPSNWTQTFTIFLPLCHWNSWPTIDGTPMSKNLNLIKHFKNWTKPKEKKKYTNWTLKNRKSNCKKTVFTKKVFFSVEVVIFQDPERQIRVRRCFARNRITESQKQQVILAPKYLYSVTRIIQKYWHFLSLLKVARTVIATVNTWLPSSSFLRIEYWCRVFNAVELLLTHCSKISFFVQKYYLTLSFAN